MFFNAEDTYFPSNTIEERRRFVSASENVGHDMTFKIHNSSTNKIINRYYVRPANDDESPHIRANPLTFR